MAILQPGGRGIVGVPGQPVMGGGAGAVAPPGAQQSTPKGAVLNVGQAGGGGGG